ncbi:MAG: RDD family protein [Psychrobium sp.]
MNEDTKDRITPVAFAPDESLFDLPLARPWRRAGAMLCDLMIVAVLTSMDDVVLISMLLVVWLFHKARVWQLLGKIPRHGVWLIRGGSLIIVMTGFYLASLMVGQTDNHSNSDDDDSLVAELALAGLSAYNNSQCPDAECWKPVLEIVIAQQLATNKQPQQSDVIEIVEKFLKTSGIEETEQQALRQWSETYDGWKNNEVQASQDEATEVVLTDDADKELTDNTEQESSALSPMQWLFGFINDLGLGFGFAAIYFTCFTAWFNGQTLGKMLFNTRVLQLSNEPMGLWDSFGRYGGYGAGLATGLLGFIQVYWDANRQAIQDKISATVVIDLNLAAREGKLAAVRNHSDRAENEENNDNEAVS